MAKQGKKTAGSHGTKNIQSQLDALEEDGWDDTSENAGFTEVPTGDYHVKIAKVGIGNSKSSGRLQVSFELQIVGGESAVEQKYKNRKLFLHIGLDTEENRGRLRHALAKLGVEWPKAADLPATLEELVGTFAKVHVNTKPSTKNEGEMSSWTNFVAAMDEDEIEEGDGDDADEVEEKPKKGKGKKSKKEEPDDDEDSETDDESEDEDEDEKPKKGKKGKKPADDDDDEEEDDSDEEDSDEEDDEDEEEKPKTSGKGGKGGGGKKKAPADDEGEDASDDEDEEDEPKAKKGKKGKVVEEAEVTVDFEDDDLTPKEKKAIKALAETNDFDLDNYDDLAALCVDLAEHVGLSGKFAKASKLIAKIEEKSETDDE